MICSIRTKLPFFALLLCLLSGCASNQENQNTQTRSDPLEGFNRTMFNFNYNYLDPYVLRPVAVAWRNYVPVPVRSGLSNFSSNLGEPASMVNSFLRGEPTEAMKHFSRFLINTTFGLAGLIDVASTVGDGEIAKGTNMRFGGVLGHYGVGYGPYVVLPVYGSATPREDIGGLVDYAYPAYSLLAGWPAVGLFIFDGIEARARLLDQDQLLKDSSDPYIFMREAYFQNKDFQTNRGQLSDAPNPNAQELTNSLDEIDSLD